jgi:branched-chain amino acid transport system substrate-binding protein
MKKLLFLVAVGLLAFTAWSMWGSFEHKGEHRFEALSRPAKEIVVGVCWPFSVNQDGMADGLQLALDEINSGNLAGGHTIRLVIRDDAFDWQKGKRIAVEFADTSDMSAVIGYYDDGFAIKASTIFESSRLLHLIVGANNTAMTAHGFQYLARTTLSSVKIAKSLARITAGHGYRRIAVLWEEDAYGEDLAYQYRVGLDNMNAELVYQWSYSRDRADFRLPVNELKGIDADVIFFAGLEPWAGDFLRAARGVGLKTPIIGAFSDTPEMRKRAGQALEGAMYLRCTTWILRARKTSHSFASSAPGIAEIRTHGPPKATMPCTSWRRPSNSRGRATRSIYPTPFGTWTPGKAPTAGTSSTAQGSSKTSPYSSKCFSAESLC